MADAKLKIKELNSEIKTLEDEAIDLQTKAFSLRQEQENLISKMILEDGLLANSDWEIFLDSSNNVSLKYIPAAKPSSSMEFVVSLTRTDYHSWFYLEEGIQLSFDDAEISLTFKENKQAVSFIKRYKLNVSGTGIIDRLTRLKRDVAALEAIYHQFNSVL